MANLGDLRKIVYKTIEDSKTGLTASQLKLVEFNGSSFAVSMYIEVTAGSVYKFNLEVSSDGKYAISGISADSSLFSFLIANNSIYLNSTTNITAITVRKEIKYGSIADAAVSVPDPIVTGSPVAIPMKAGSTLQSLYVEGALDVDGNTTLDDVEVSGVTNITNTTASTSTTTGALKVAGGAGVAGSLYVGTSIFENGKRVMTEITDSGLTTGEAITEISQSNNELVITRDEFVHVGTSEIHVDQTIYGQKTWKEASTFDASVDINASVDIDASAGSLTADVQSVSLDSTADSNFTVTGASATASNLTLSALNSSTGTADVLISAKSEIDITAPSIDINGAVDISSTLAVTGNTTLTGDLAVNGGDVTTTAESFNLLSANAATVSAFGAATALTIGATTGTTTIRNATTAVSNALTVGTTLGVTGVTTLTDLLNANGGIAVDTDKFTVAGDGTGNTAIAGTLGVTGNTTLTGDLAVNGGDLTTSATSFNLLNKNLDADLANQSYTVNIAGGTDTQDPEEEFTITRTVNISHEDATLNINGSAITIGDSTSAVTIDGTITIAGEDLVITGTTKYDSILLSADYGSGGVTTSPLKVVDTNGTSADVTFVELTAEGLLDVNVQLDHDGLFSTNTTNAGITTASGEVDITATNVDINGATTIDGSSVSLDSTADSNFTVTGASTTASNLTLSAANSSTGTATVLISGKTEVDITATNVDINGATTIDGSSISLDSTADSNFTVTGATSATSNLTLSALNSSTGNASLILSGKTEVDITAPTIDINGSTSIDGSTISLDATGTSSNFTLTNSGDSNATLTIKAENTNTGDINKNTIVDIIAANNAADTQGSTMINLSADSVVVSNDLSIGGNFSVTGTINYLNQTYIQIEDKELQLGVVETPSNTTASGGGIRLEAGEDGDKTFLWNSTDGWNSSEKITASSFVGSLSGNADTVTNGVYTAGNQTIGGVKTFSQDIVGNITGNSATADKVNNALTVGTYLSLSNSGTSFDGSTAYTINHDDSGVTANSYGDTADQTPAYGGTFKVPSFTVDAQGHLTAAGEHTVTIPATDDTTYSISTEAGADDYKEIIRLTAGGSGSGTDDVILAVGSTGASNTYGLTIEESGDTITFKHADTSSQASLTALEGANVVSDVDLDEFGHVTLLSTRALTLEDLGYVAPTVNNGTLTMNVSGTGLSGSATFTANQSGASTFTVTSNATSANTASTIVARDANGDFSARNITLTGDISVNGGDITSTGDLAIDAAGNDLVIKHRLVVNENSATTTTDDYALYVGSGGAGANANVYIAGNLYFPSDERLKNKHEVVSSSVLDSVLETDIWKFAYKANPDQVEIGVMAQDLERNFPGLAEQLVTSSQTEQFEDQKALKESKLVYVLWAALQEESKKRQELEVKLNKIIEKLGE